MKPLGRKYYKDKCKQYIKNDGKHVPMWWEYVCVPSKSVEKERTRREIQSELDSYYRK